MSNKESKFIKLISFSVLAAGFLAAPARANDHIAVGNWSGIIVGVHGGGAWQDSAARFDSAGDDTRVSPNLDGEVFGLHGGYRRQFGNVVVGIIGDYTARPGSNETFRNDADVESFDDVTLDPESLWSVRGELGYAFGNFLLYGTAGIGGADYKISGVTPNSNVIGSISDEEEGFVFGGGIEWQFHQNVSFGVTYLRYDVGTTIAIADSDLPDSDTGDFAKFDDIDVLRANVTFQLTGN